MADLPEPSPHRALRVSNVDRERVAEILRDAATDGRLDLDELDDRLRQVYATKTYGELEPLTLDLPSGGVVPVPHLPPDVRVGGRPTSTSGIAVMSGFVRKGPWVVPRLFTCLAVMGGGTIDLREARFAEREVRIRAFAIMGGVEIIVPENAEVHVVGNGIMGGFDHGASSAGAPGGPRIIVTGLAIWGGVEVKRKTKKAS